MTLTDTSEECTYNPHIFTVIDEAAAKRIILTPEGGSRTIERWTIETPYLVRLIMDHVILDRNSLVLDYGCGIGRIAKELIKQTGCHVIGVDISPSMLGLAYPYVHSDNFSAISRTTFAGRNYSRRVGWSRAGCLGGG